jgi:hypothetical protein
MFRGIRRHEVCYENSLVNVSDLRLALISENYIKLQNCKKKVQITEPRNNSCRWKITGSDDGWILSPGYLQLPVSLITWYLVALKCNIIQNEIFKVKFALMMEATSISVTLANFYQTTRRNPEDSHIRSRWGENVRSHCGLRWYVCRGGMFSLK